MSASKFMIREMAEGEESVLWRLFHETIHTINQADYTSDQLAAWSPPDRDMTEWGVRMRGIAPFVVTVEAADGQTSGDARQIVGFSDLQSDGLIDFMFVHHAWQGCGVASRLMAEIERRAQGRNLSRLYAHVSRTAQPFFRAHGFSMIERQTVEIRGTTMDNAKMVKLL